MYALAIHGGAGALPRAHYTAAREAEYRDGLARALDAGRQLLQGEGSALDAVEAAVSSLEDNPLFNAGLGAVLTATGTVELDAAIMDGSNLRAGAVAVLRHVRNPIQLARRVLEDGAHVFLVGEGAERFAAELGIEAVSNELFITPYRREQLRELQQHPGPGASAALDEPPFGTVGAVARDRRGNLAAATSTGGTAGKRPGRVGDSPVIGAGTYADNATCAVSTTGHGEWFLRTVQAYDIAARLRYGAASLSDAVKEAVSERLPRLGGSGGLIAVGRDGQIVMRRNTPAMFRASLRSDSPPSIDIY
jgi:beta-aspartyl-peptidase (threonine type)